MIVGHSRLICLSGDNGSSPKYKANVVRTRFWPPQANIKQIDEPVNQSSPNISRINSASTPDLPALVIGNHANAEQRKLTLQRLGHRRAEVRPLISMLSSCSNTKLHVTVKSVATSHNQGAADRARCIDALPFIACRIEGCWRQATLWSTIEKRPYCVVCWNDSSHHVTQNVKLNCACSRDEEPVTHDIDKASRPKPTVCGRLRTGPVGNIHCSNFNARTLSLVAIQGCRACARGSYRARRRSTCRPISWRDPIRDVPPTKLLALAGHEPSYMPPEFAIPASGYTTLFEPPTDATIALYKAHHH